MRLGAITFNLFKDNSLEEIIQMLEDAGLEGVELRTTHAHGVEPTIDAAERKRVKELFEKSAVRLVAYGTTCDFHHPEASDRAAQVALGKQFIDLAKDTGAIGIKVRPNGLPEGVPVETTVGRIADSLKELGYYAAGKGIEVWVEVHGKGSMEPSVMHEIIKATSHPQVNLCWNCNGPDVIDGSVKTNFDLLKPWIRHCHIHDLTDNYPYRELFGLLKAMDYKGYTLIEAPASCETERFLKYYRALWMEMTQTR